MKKFVKVAGLSLAVVSSSFFAHAAEAAQKVGYVNTAYVINQLPQREAMTNKVQAALKDDRAELEKLSAAINTKGQELERNAALLGEDGIEKLRVDIARLQAEGQIKKEMFNAKGKRIDAQLRQQMLDLIQEAAEKIAKKEGFDMVLDSQMLLYSNQESDLTKKVIAELK